jgi:hypothetical protein
MCVCRYDDNGLNGQNQLCGTTVELFFNCDLLPGGYFINIIISTTGCLSVNHIRLFWFSL